MLCKRDTILQAYRHNSAYALPGMYNTTYQTKTYTTYNTNDTPAKTLPCCSSAVSDRTMAHNTKAKRHVASRSRAVGFQAQRQASWPCCVAVGMAQTELSSELAFERGLAGPPRLHRSSTQLELHEVADAAGRGL